jgi:hypothetical protein
MSFSVVAGLLGLLSIMKRTPSTRENQVFVLVEFTSSMLEV